MEITLKEKPDVMGWLGLALLSFFIFIMFIYVVDISFAFFDQEDLQIINHGGFYFWIAVISILITAITMFKFRFKSFCSKCGKDFYEDEMADVSEKPQNFNTHFCAGCVTKLREKKWK